MRQNQQIPSTSLNNSRNIDHDNSLIDYHFNDKSIDHHFNNYYHSNSNFRNIEHHSSNSHEQTQQRTENITSELKQFLTDHDARVQLNDLKEEVNIRELAQSYNINNKKKKKQKLFSYSPMVFLLRKTKNNRVPIPGHPK
jgi:hypothetical protein